MAITHSQDASVTVERAANCSISSGGVKVGVVGGDVPAGVGYAGWVVGVGGAEPSVSVVGGSWGRRRSGTIAAPNAWTMCMSGVVAGVNVIDNG